MKYQIKWLANRCQTQSCLDHYPPLLYSQQPLSFLYCLSSLLNPCHFYFWLFRYTHCYCSTILHLYIYLYPYPYPYDYQAFLLFWPIWISICFIGFSSFLYKVYLFICVLCLIANSSCKRLVFYACIILSIMNNLVDIASWLNDISIFIFTIAGYISVYQLDLTSSIILRPILRFRRYLIS